MPAVVTPEDDDGGVTVRILLHRIENATKHDVGKRDTTRAPGTEALSPMAAHRSPTAAGSVSAASSGRSTTSLRTTRSPPRTSPAVLCLAALRAGVALRDSRYRRPRHACPPRAAATRITRPQSPTPTIRRAKAWAKLMARVEEEFPRACPTCGGDIRLIAFKLFYQCETIPGLRTVGNLRLLRTSRTGPEDSHTPRRATRAASGRPKLSVSPLTSRPSAERPLRKCH
jgi:hypothetical protein